MNTFFLRLLRLFFGLFLYAVGIILTMKGNIGYAPWEVFHAGLAKVLGMQIGTVSILVGLAICGIVLLSGEKLGLGTLCNMVFVGLFMNLLLGLDFIPKQDTFLLGALQMIAGLFVISFATYHYISSGFGAGPRDSLMVVLTRKTKLSVGVCRSGMEILVVTIGAFLGGLVGLGTLLAAVAIGFCIQLTFKVLHFDPTKVVHETFFDTFRNLSKVKVIQQPPLS
ncbi:hypothetical protein [Sphaerochaeta sp. PS]|uniref:YczE/YyaS/YitT family protein n=1 Tax=Sphaerochaeta sp. PS TaxID=3076336 RepID=UPI0028A3FD5C|nr:hypothetical protein [Sphaerochaeta sp. PS]MDT4761668.1 hypothetical protein [Sphaerochaeta sp. PS]